MLIIKSHQGMVVFLRVSSFPVKGMGMNRYICRLQWSDSLDMDLPQSGQESVKAGALVNILPTPKRKHASWYPEEEKGKTLENL